ncbi:lipoprotein [Mycoplasma putrefaciens]|uniref:Lipoprotein n=1 Tax=Mycoplasma putrefaciens (strain ATCC 15718 / NCTC 10155 / C30 KS-1 / KS-1) TaxID=743965 RepID=A0A7U3ZS04_MYCPK|nr:lipoprotein [Mycoplasma putrefaciens]AEM68423.1 lipoprotein [Mycoplasma putrefaciens KS1]
MKRFLPVLGTIGIISSTGMIAVACTKVVKISSNDGNTDYKIFKEVGSWSEKLVEKLLKEEEKAKKILESEEASVLFEIYTFYTKSKSFDSLEKAVETLTKGMTKTKEEIKKQLLEGITKILEKYNKYKDKIETLLKNNHIF